MLGGIFWILAGAGFLAKEVIASGIRQAEDTNNRKWIDSVTDKELEQKLWKDIHDPRQYNAIWERIEKYKEDDGHYAICYPYAGAWESVGEKRYAFFNKNGVAIKAYEGNREFAHRKLMQTYDLLTYDMALSNSPQHRRIAEKHKRKYGF